MDPRENGLLFAKHLLKCLGHETLYLGLETSYSDLKKIADSYQPDFAFTVLTFLNLRKNINKIIGKVMDHLNVLLLVTGSLISEFDVLVQDRLTPPKNVSDMTDFLEYL
ncbi:hypothetical protein H9X96_09510 [Pedobacter sp. N36a]|uniref:hypothetical protein n=1 Tax=Pedobacter sp. N36a TaxID=2767996 RepID=UPI0016574AED|nr:hypothetical protein [Pedobacter sp. N36a]MBC8986013.1 hypothetical protein [Pedobacter sp. N36a]